MNWKAISFALLGIGGFLTALIDSAADRHLASSVDKQAVLDRDEQTVEKLDSALKIIETVDELNRRERKEIGDEVKKWKLANNYDTRLSEIHANAMNELNEFKRSVNYFDRKQEIEDNAESALDIFKESIEYDFEIEKLEEEIENAKSAYKKRTKLYELAGHGDDDISDTVGELKKAEKSKMESAVKKAQDKINELKNKVSAEKTKIDRKKQQELRELESEIQTVKTRITKVENEAADVVRKEFDKADMEIRLKVCQKRTEAENDAIDIYEDCKEVLEEQKHIDAEYARELYDLTPKAQKWADWLKANKVPKWLVVFFGLLPYIPAGYLLVSYTTFFAETVKAM